jgi:hypothetical protein
MGEGFNEKNSATEMVAIESQMKAFHQMMASAKRSERR